MVTRETKLVRRERSRGPIEDAWESEPRTQ